MRCNVSYIIMCYEYNYMYFVEVCSSEVGTNVNVVFHVVYA